MHATVILSCIKGFINFIYLYIVYKLDNIIYCFVSLIRNQRRMNLSMWREMNNARSIHGQDRLGSEPPPSSREDWEVSTHQEKAGIGGTRTG